MGAATKEETTDDRCRTSALVRLKALRFLAGLATEPDKYQSRRTL
jgi:hypothetical protein